MRMLIAILTAGVLTTFFVGGAPTPSEAQKPKARPSAGAEVQHVEGRVKSVDPAANTVTLDDGTTLEVTGGARAKLGQLKPGTMIKASYETRNGQKVATALEVEKK